MTDNSKLHDDIMKSLEKVFDPEIPVDIVNLGLIYGVDILENMDVNVVMSLTSPSCPSAAELPADAEKRVREVEGVKEVTVNVVWDPPWGPEMISPVGRVKLGMDEAEDDSEETEES